MAKGISSLGLSWAIGVPVWKHPIVTLNMFLFVLFVFIVVIVLVHCVLASVSHTSIYTDVLSSHAWSRRPSNTVAHEDD